MSENIELNEDEVQVHFIRTSGPGGQHVNKTSTGVQIRFDVAGSPSFSEGVRQRLRGIAGSRLTKEGVLVISATTKRSQTANRRDAIARLVSLIAEAEKVPKSRRKTRPSAGVNKRRLENKQRRGDLKRSRGRVRGHDD